MTIYTESTLDTLENQADGDIRNAPRRAGRMYLMLPEDQRSYANVASKYRKSDGQAITEGRAAVYVREYLVHIGKEDEAPQRGRRNGGGGARVTTGNDVLDNTLAQREQFLTEQDRVATMVTDANTAVEEFTADEWIAEAANDLREQINELQRRLDAWESNEDNIATTSAEQYEKDLRDRAERLEKESADKLEFLSKQVGTLDAMLKLIVGMDPDALKRIKEQNADLGNEVEAAITEPQPETTA